MGLSVTHRCSTPRLHSQNDTISDNHWMICDVIRIKRANTGAGDGTRTRDDLLGRQGLYQTELPPRRAPIIAVGRGSRRPHDAAIASTAGAASARTR